jgi:hypothetical protein
MALAYCRGSQAPLPVPDVPPDVEELDVVVPVVAGPTVGAPELVVLGELVEVGCGLPLPVVEDVVLDWSSAVVGSEVVGVVDDVPLADVPPPSEPSGVPLAPVVVDDAPVLPVPPVVVLEVDCAAGSVMWPARTGL